MPPEVPEAPGEAEPLGCGLHDAKAREPSQPSLTEFGSVSESVGHDVRAGSCC